MPSIPVWLRAAHITAVTVTPQTVAANGALSDGTPIALAAKLRDLDDELEDQTEEINPITSGRLNNVPIAQGYRCAIEFLGVNDATDPDPILTAWLANSIFKLAYAVGTGDSARVKTIYGCRSRKSFKTNGKGAPSLRFEILCVDVGATDFVTWSDPTP